jgi:flagellar hook-associated protein 3 FlgL
MLMRSNLLMNSIRTNSVDMLKVQNQLSTGLRLARPSDDPADASTIMNLDSTLERQHQYSKNIDYALDFYASTDNALGQANELATNAHTLALASIGNPDAAKSNAILIEQIIDQLVSIGNQTCRGSYIFGGQNSTLAPFEGYKGGVLFSGDLGALQTRMAQYSLVDFNVNGDETFGALSSQVQGIVDLNPDITTDTLLSDLNGALGQGIRSGSIIINDGTNTDTVDLSNCITVGDIINKINDGTPATTTASIGADGTSLQVSSTLGGASLTINEVGTGSTASDLGIFDDVGGAATISGQDVDARLSLTTPVTALAGGAGIDSITGGLNNGIKITNSLLEDINPIDIDDAQTLGDIINAINNAQIGVRAEINADGTGINVLNQLSGSEMAIGEDGGTTATEFGIRSMHSQSVLTGLNGGQGVGVMDETVPGEIRITDRQGATYDVDLSTAITVQDVIDLINAATGGNVTADLSVNGNGIELTDTTGGLGDFSVTTISQNGHFVAKQLGFNDDQNNDGLSVSSNTLTGKDVNKIKPDGLFSHLIALRDAMLACDDTAIGLADNAVVDDRKNVSNIRGKVGSIMQAAEARKFHMQDNILATETLRSDIRDIDFTEAITRYQNLYTALQGNLMTGGQLTSISLLDFLR